MSDLGNASSSSVPNANSAPAAGPPVPMGKRRWDAWSEKEVEGFFEGIENFGVREFAKMAQLLGTKTKEQVRHYYYRLLKKINLCLQHFGRTINKQDREEVKRALLCWYHHRKREGSLTASPPKGSTSAKVIGNALCAAISESSASASSASISTTTSVTGTSSSLLTSTSPSSSSLGISMKSNALPNTSKHLPTNGNLQPSSSIPSPSTLLSHTSPSTSQMNFPSISSPTSDETGAPAPERLTLQLVPKEPEVSSFISSAGFNPFLQLTFSSKKSIGSIIVHITKKWSFVPAPIRVYPISSVHYPQGWGRESTGVSMGVIYSLLGRPPIMQLWYSWLTPQASPPPQSNIPPRFLKSETMARPLTHPMLPTIPMMQAPQSSSSSPQRQGFLPPISVMPSPNQSPLRGRNFLTLSQGPEMSRDGFTVPGELEESEVRRYYPFENSNDSSSIGFDKYFGGAAGNSVTVTQPSGDLPSPLPIRKRRMWGEEKRKGDGRTSAVSTGDAGALDEEEENAALTLGELSYDGTGEEDEEESRRKRRRVSEDGEEEDDDDPPEQEVDDDEKEEEEKEIEEEEEKGEEAGEDVAAGGGVSGGAGRPTTFVSLLDENTNSESCFSFSNYLLENSNPS